MCAIGRNGRLTRCASYRVSHFNARGVFLNVPIVRNDELVENQQSGGGFQRRASVWQSRTTC